MHFYRFVLAVFLGLGGALTALAEVTKEEVARLLPDKVGNFSASSSVAPMLIPESAAQAYKINLAAGREYRNAKGQRISVLVWRAASDNAAYSLLQKGNLFSKPVDEEQKSLPFGTKGVGNANPRNNKRTADFFQGPVSVRLETTADYQTLIDFGRKLAETLDKGEGEIPSLVRHLPDGGQEHALYAVTSAALNDYVKSQPVLSAVNFEGGTEAVVAQYGDAQMVIAEFSTPQLATANDAAIQNKIKELQAAGQSAPTAYKREGNYGVFVFNAPDAAAAQNLISQVKYEKTVQWLGENPNILIRAQKRYVAIASGVFVSVIKASGLAILLALGVGGLIGALVFRRRRAQDLEAAAYSDAGGMMRLNLDEMTPAEANPARLLETKEM